MPEPERVGEQLDTKEGNGRRLIADKQDCDDLKTWNSTGGLCFEPSKPDGDPWRAVFDALVAEDRLQCEAWKDEVQNLLIFAGLFSAVVTAFVVESYKSLQPDPQQDTVKLLEYLVLRMDGLNSTATGAPQTLSMFDIQPVTKRVNALWFISLIISLSTVLVGITTLQWLREHQRYKSGIEPRTAVAIFRMRAQGLQDWGVPRIFAALPILLQLSLLLFFIGLVDFLIDLSGIVAAPSIIAMSVIWVFLLLTTALPALQAFSFSVIRKAIPMRVTTLPPSQCPYKSPQSLAFRRILIPNGLTLFSMVHRGISRVILGYHKVIGKLISSSVPSKWTLYEDLTVFFTWEESTWWRFDKRWVTLRGRYAHEASMMPTSQTKLESQPDIFDAFDALIGYQHDDMNAAYWSVQTLAESVPFELLIGVIDRLSGYAGHGKAHPAFSNAPQEVKRDEVHVQALRAAFPSYRNAPNEFDLPVAELEIRLLKYFLGGAPISKVEVSHNHSKRPFVWLWSFNKVAGSNKQIREQYLLILRSLLDAIYTTDSRTISCSYHGSYIASGPLTTFANTILPDPNADNDNQVFDILEGLRDQLRSFIDRPPLERPVYPFVYAAIIARNVVDTARRCTRDPDWASNHRYGPKIEKYTDELLHLLATYEHGMDEQSLRNVYEDMIEARYEFPSLPMMVHGWTMYKTWQVNNRQRASFALH